MRIVLVSDSYPPLIGGATMALHQLATELTRLRHEVTVITAWQAIAPMHERSERVDIHRVRDLTSRLSFLSSDPHRHTPPPFPDPEAILGIRSILRRTRPDVVYAYGWLTYSCAAAMLGMSTPLIVGARDYGNICALRTLVRHGAVCDGPALRKCLECATSFYGTPKGLVAVTGVLGGRALLRRKLWGLQSCSSYVQGLMHRFLLGSTALPPNRDTVIPDFRPRAHSGEIDYQIMDRLPTRPFILFVGAMRQIKGLDPLLAAYGRLIDPPPLVLMGTRAPDTPQAFAPGITVVLDVPHTTVMAAWARALFGVAPSILPEPLGNVVHEAMSQGKPVIGTTPGGHQDMIIQDETGLLVQAGDVDGLTSAMNRLISDVAFRERLGRAAKAQAERFTVDSVMPRFEELFEAAGANLAP